MSHLSALQTYRTTLHEAIHQPERIRVFAARMMWIARKVGTAELIALHHHIIVEAVNDQTIPLCNLSTAGDFLIQVLEHSKEPTHSLDVDPHPEIDFSRNRYRALFEQSHDGIFIIDLAGQYIEVNQRAAEMLGYPLDELRLMHSRDVMLPDERQDASNRLDRLLSGEKLPIYERTFVRKNGSLLFAEISVALIRDVYGTPIHIQSVVHDITQRKQLEKRLRIYQKTVQSSSNGIVIVDRELPDMPITYINAAFERMTGYSAEEVIGRNCRFMHGADRAQAGIEQMRNAIRNGEKCSVLLRNYRKDGTLFWNQLHIDPITDGHGQVTHYVGIQNDVTTLQYAEVQLTQALEKERELNQLRSRFVSMASHEIRTPLSIIRSASETLRDFFHKMSDEQRQRKFKTIEDQILHTVALLDNVLMLGKLESSDQSPTLTKFELLSTMQAFLDDFTSVQTTHNVEYSAPDGELWVTADRNLMRQVITNLLSNAIKYSPNADRVSLTLGHDEGELIIAVRDYGIGIPDEDQKRIFGGFQRAKNVGQIKGFGLGLAIVKRAIELHHGTIQMSSEVNVGTQFCIRLPIINQMPLMEARS
jgi:PAS domain S-box-containing protein